MYVTERTRLHTKLASTICILFLFVMMGVFYTLVFVVNQYISYRLIYMIRYYSVLIDM
jgi:hypothetical protein